MVVWGRKETDLTPPPYGVQGVGAPDQEAVERYKEGPWVEAPQGPLGQVVVEGEVHGGGLGFLGQHKGGMH